MTDEQHIELAKALNGVKGKVAISNYSCELMDELYPSTKWTKIYAPAKQINSTHDVRQEVLWINYTLDKDCVQQLVLEEPTSAVSQPLKEAFISLRKVAES